MKKRIPKATKTPTGRKLRVGIVRRTDISRVIAWESNIAWQKKGILLGRKIIQMLQALM